MKDTDEYIGQELGNYIVGARMSRGGFGSVYFGQRKVLSRLVAIKVLHTKYLASEKERERFLQEAKLLETLKHPHCLLVYDAGTRPVYNAGVCYDLPYLISQYAAGGYLRDRLNKADRPFSLNDALSILTQVAEALSYAHQKEIIHRDLKPENILFDEREEVLLADFGLAIILQTATTQPASIAGTPGYMAPEQAAGTVSKRSDQYALGCIAYELLTGQLPYASRSSPASQSSPHETGILIPPSAHNPHIPPYIEHALLKALEKHREDRYADKRISPHIF